MAANVRLAGSIAVVMMGLTIQAHTYAAATNFIPSLVVSCVVAREHTIAILSCVVKATPGASWEERNVAGWCSSCMFTSYAYEEEPRKMLFSNLLQTVNTD